MTNDTLSLRTLFLLKVGGEAGEISRAVEKCASYGLENPCPPGYKESGIRNIDRLRQEIIDLLGNWELFADKCQLDGIYGMSLLSAIGMPKSFSDGLDYYQKNYDGIDPTVLQKIIDRKNKVLKSLDNSIAAGTLADVEVQKHPTPRTLLPGDILVEVCVGMQPENTIPVYTLRLYDPSRPMLPYSDRLKIQDMYGRRYGILRKVVDTTAWSFIHPSEVGFTPEWLAGNGRHLYPYESTGAYDTIAKLYTDYPHAYEPWLDRVVI